MSSEAQWADDKREVKLAVAVCAVVAACLVALILIVGGMIWFMGLVTTGPHQSARNNLYSQCSERFDVGVYDEPCLTIVKSR